MDGDRTGHPHATSDVNMQQGETVSRLSLLGIPPLGSILHIWTTTQSSHSCKMEERGDRRDGGGGSARRNEARRPNKKALRSRNLTRAVNCGAD